ncbi:hypothetical protein QBC34DRAFT_198201 [Podospora aff. communis PSN243]|uniref:Uncharacterized protein n=1 Tax=Podospora aff. communis PSN243 TaxID=3040156 RepID=A0AAV9G631_9PEZI|nr:hypothetical protein QBC34DRAFT_198201 [Podospora aff. communis PSN243]
MAPNYHYAGFFLVAVMLVLPAAAERFEVWYPQYGQVFEILMNTHCSSQLDDFRHGNASTVPLDFLGGGDEPSRLIQPLVLCILDNTPEYIKVAMSASQVLLGVTPTILSILGASVEESALLFIVGRRPVLAWLLALGSPSVYFNRAFEYRSPFEILQGHQERINIHRPRRTWAVAITVLEYILAALSMVNMGMQTWQLGLRTFCSVWPDSYFAPSLWVILRIALHCISLLLVRLRIRRNFNGVEAGERMGFREWMRGVLGRVPVFDGFKSATNMELSPCVMQKQADVETFGESKTYVCLAWLLHTLTVVHILYGTLTFSSLSFIGTRDAISVLGRFMASVLTCRVILMYEIAGLREAYLENNGSTEVTMITQVASTKSQPGLW